MYKKLFDKLAQNLKVLSHSERLEIVNLLCDRPLCVQEIHSMLGFPQAVTSQHLMILRESGLVKTRRKGKRIFYELCDPKLLKVLEITRDILLECHKKETWAKKIKQELTQLTLKVEDPVCKMKLCPKSVLHTHKFKGKIYFFCGKGCLEKFQNNSQKFI